MWRFSVNRKRSESSILSSKSADTSTDSLPRPSRKSPSPTARSTLSEVLRNNPFRTVAKDVTKPPVTAAIDPVKSLNEDLQTLANIYPDVQVDVLRELLFRFDGDSRLHVCTEQLFRYKSEWARGRLVTPPRDPDDKLAPEDLFRDQDYVKACKRTLYAEFKALNRSAIDAVLAETNNNYIQSRPILQEISARSWKAALVSLFRKRRAGEEPPPFLVERSRTGEQRLLSTANLELDAELAGLFLKISRTLQSDQQRQADFELARDLNRRQAEEEGALFECQCCYDDVPFEQITTCTAEGHVMCVDCVQRAFSEAVFGQSWNKSVDTLHSTLKCFAPTTIGECHGQLQHDVLCQVVHSMPSGKETWAKFEQRLFTDSLTRSNLQLQHCPFCSYAEVQEPYSLDSASKIRWKLQISPVTAMTITTVIVLFPQILLLAAAVLLAVCIFYYMSLPLPSWRKSLINVLNRRQTQRFKCQSQACGKKSCTVCHKQWHDPHVCHEPLIQSLRTAVEAARTAALKRVCPRCGTAFVKDSGCNKLVCVCGYAMCYLCRKNIGKVATAPGAGPAAGRVAAHEQINLGLEARNQAQAVVVDDEELAAAGEGYRHFCPHFRPLPNQKCTECDKCDLYRNEDEDAMVQRAGELAEQAWRDQYEQNVNTQQPGHEKVTLKGLENALDGIDDGNATYLWGVSKQTERMLWRVMTDVRRGRLGPQGMLDAVVEKWVSVKAEERQV